MPHRCRNWLGVSWLTTILKFIECKNNIFCLLCIFIDTYFNVFILTHGAGKYRLHMTHSLDYFVLCLRGNFFFSKMDFFIFFSLIFLHSRFYSCPCPPSHSSSSHFSSSPVFRRYPPPHPTRPPYTLGPQVPWVRCIFSHWGPTKQSSAVYVLEALDQLMYAAWLVSQCLRDHRGLC